MQGEIQASPHWLQIALGLVAAFFTGGGIFKLYDTWLNRKKPAAELTVTEATATEIQVRAGSTAGDAVMRMMARLDMAQETIDRLRAERDGWQDEYDKVFVQRDQLVIEIGKLRGELKLYDEEIKTMRATLTLKDTNYDNTKHIALDKPKELDPQQS